MRSSPTRPPGTRTPPVLLLTGTALAAGTAQVLARTPETAAAWLLAGPAALLAVAAYLKARPATPPAVTQALLGVAITLTSAIAATHASTSTTWAVIAGGTFTALAPVTLIWPVFTATAAFTLASSLPQYEPGTTIALLAVLASAALLKATLQRDEQQHARTEEQLRAERETDPLTGILNRAGAHERIVRAWAHAARRGEHMTVLFCDVHGLKHINDTRGHDAGDQVLIDAATALTRVFRSEDIIARWGGDEFIVVTTSPHDDTDNYQDRINAALATSGTTGTQVSVGAARGPASHTPFTQLLTQADIDMYQARRQAQQP